VAVDLVADDLAAGLRGLAAFAATRLAAGFFAAFFAAVFFAVAFFAVFFDLVDVFLAITFTPSIPAYASAGPDHNGRALRKLIGAVSGNALTRLVRSTIPTSGPPLPNERARYLEG
jgi:hypothetical protein